MNSLKAKKWLKTYAISLSFLRLNYKNIEQSYIKNEVIVVKQKLLS